MAALAIVGLFLWAHVVVIAGAFSSPKASVPQDCEPYNVGRVECGAKSGGNPRASAYAPKPHEKTEAEGLAEWVREAQEKAPR